MTVQTSRTFFQGPLRAVVFDWAGTVIDHGCMAPVGAFQEVFAERGVEVTVSEVRQFMGMVKREHLEAMAQLPRVREAWVKALGNPPQTRDIDAMYARLLPMQVRAVAAHAKVIEGVPALLRALRAQGLRIGSSTGYPDTVMEVLEPLAMKQGWDPDVVVTASDLRAGRPAPWEVFLAMQRLDVFPPAAVVKVDDSVAGVVAGRNAGVWAVGVTLTGNQVGMSESDLESLSSHEKKALHDQAARRFVEAGAHAVVASVRELPGVLERINRRLVEGRRP